MDDEGPETIELAPVCCVREILSLRNKAVIREMNVEGGLKTWIRKAHQMGKKS